MDVRRRAKRRTASRSSIGCRVDLISRLGDDVLVHILGLLPTATDVVRTGALSRRWRHLWTLVPALRFAVGPRPKPGNAPRYVAFVDGVLARRAGAETNARIEELLISCVISQRYPEEYFSSCITAARVHSWLRHGMQQAVKSFTLELPPSLMSLYELPSATGLESMRLTLGGAILRFPAVAAFDSLTDLSLEHIRFAAGNGHLLGHVLSSTCCPRLRKLSLRSLLGPTQLRLEASALLELFLLSSIFALLQVKAPNLRVLDMEDCIISLEVEGSTASILAPRLEELAFSCDKIGPAQFKIEDLSAVRSLKIKMLRLPSHANQVHAGVNDVSLGFLQRCSSVVDRLSVRLHVPNILKMGAMIEDEHMIDMMEDLPQLPHITDLSVQVFAQVRQAFVASVAGVLARCANLKYLDLELEVQCVGVKEPLCSAADCICALSKKWQYHNISLEHLQEVKLRGFRGAEYEITRLVEWLLAKALALQKITIELGLVHLTWTSEDYRKFFLGIPCARGKWISRSNGPYLYEWAPS